MDAINPGYKAKRKSNKSIDEFINGINAGNRYILSELITMLESSDLEQKSLGLQILSKAKSNAPSNNPTMRIGITGSPGVGKSTFINAYASYLSSKGKTVAVLAIDPSSLPTKGSILGDKTRMVDLTSLKEVYIRPSPAGDLLGGVARGTKEAIEACEVFGFDVILLETVGVGQSEHLASQIVDLTILLLQIGAGDDIQGIKRGIIEMADIFVVNKDDGEHKTLVRDTLSYYRQALSFVKQDYNIKYARVLSSSSLEGRGFDKIDQSAISLFTHFKDSGILSQKRKEQESNWLNTMIKEYAANIILEQNDVKSLLEAYIGDPERQSLAYFELLKTKIDSIVKG
jgi:LAO/AO transport system kinase